ncbi:MAG: hypothetical protein ACREON_14410 [Gemmatimonadaceae bacterium]
MPDHLVFGECLRSDIAFPELPVIRGVSPRWTLQTVSARPAPDGGTLLGREHVDKQSYVRLFHLRDRYRLEYDDSGSFDILDRGREIRWYPGESASLDSVRLDVIGRVLALAMFASNTLCLHASAVMLPEGTIAFLGPKHHGKSTLALALVQRGARLVTDDTLPVDSGPPALAWPGVHRVRLWQDSAARLLRAEEQRPGAIGEKAVVSSLPQEALAHERTRLLALYVLAPVAAEGRPAPAGRSKLSQIHAALSLVRHAKLGALMAGQTAADMLGQATALARSTPVYTLGVVRDFDRLPEVAECLLAWHAGGDVYGVGAVAPTP